jgi:hypothetical protein
LFEQFKEAFNLPPPVIPEGKGVGGSVEDVAE